MSLSYTNGRSGMKPSRRLASSGLRLHVDAADLAPCRWSAAGCRRSCATSWSCRRRWGRESRTARPAGNVEVDVVHRGEPAVALGEMRAVGSRDPPYDGLDQVAVGVPSTTMCSSAGGCLRLARERSPPAGSPPLPDSAGPRLTPTSGCRDPSSQSVARCQAETRARRTMSCPTVILVPDDRVEHERGRQIAASRDDRRAGFQGRARRRCSANRGPACSSSRETPR